MRALGPLQVWRDGHWENLGGVKQRALLAHLALHANTDVSLDQLIEALWRATRPWSVVQNVRTYVWRLRQLLDEQLRTHGTGYVLELEADELDTLMFDELVAEAHRRLDAALRLLRRAESLWCGRALEDLPDHDAWTPCACRKLHPRWLSGAVTLVDDSPKTVTSIYVEAFDLIWFERLGPDPPGRRASERPAGAALVVAPLVLTALHRAI